MGKAKIIIKRKSEWNNRVRSMGIFIDGKRLGKLSNDEIQEFEIEAGSHEIHAEIDWCGSQKMKVDLKEGEAITLELAGSIWLRYLPQIALVIIVGYFLAASGNFEFIHVLWLIMPLMFVQLYFLTFAKDKYLELKEI